MKTKVYKVNLSLNWARGWEEGTLCALAQCLFVLWCAIGSGCRHSSRLVTRHDVCELQQFSCPCAVDRGAVDVVLGEDGGSGLGGARAR